MEKPRTLFQIDGFGAIVALIGFIMLLLFGPSVFFAIKGDKLGFAISVTVLIMLFLAGVVMAAVAIGAEYSRRTMRDGANIALAAQDFNDRWDTAKFQGATKLLIEGARAAKSLREPEIPSLPMPSQGNLDWLPPVSMLDRGDDQDWEIQ